MIAHLELWEETQDGILARVVYRIVMADYAINPDLYDAPTDRLLDLASDWRSSGIDLIAQWLTDAAIWCSNGATLATWRIYHSSIQTVSRTPAYRYRDVRKAR
jgi:hypothetical protein